MRGNFGLVEQSVAGRGRGIKSNRKENDFCVWIIQNGVSRYKSNRSGTAVAVDRMRCRFGCIASTMVQDMRDQCSCWASETPTLVPTSKEQESTASATAACWDWQAWSTWVKGGPLVISAKERYVPSP